MHFKNYDFSKLPFSNLFKSYVSNFDELAEFYEVNPFQAHSVTAFADALSFNGDRRESARLLQEFNSQFEIDDATRKNIDQLAQKKSRCIVTGQQLGLYGGPLFTMLKTAATIHLARALQQKLDRPVIPVFWLADEDHDFDEINVVNILSDEEELASFSLPPKEGGLPPVSDLTVTDEIKELQLKLRSSLIETDFSDDLWALLNNCFRPEMNFRAAFGNLIASLFSKHGLVLAGSNHGPVKEQLKQTMISAVKNADEIRDALENQSVKIAEQFHQQATIYDSHLFYLNDENSRTKIQRNESAWITETGQKWSKNELIEDIDNYPARFSPDVFLRPIMQDALLPTLGYVGGPGEVGYFGQMKSFYRCFGQRMPAIFPRLSATFIEPAIDRILGELPFAIHQYNNRIEDLESEYVDRSSKIDIEALFDEWKQEAESVSASYKKTIVEIDLTLEGAAERAQAKYFNELDRLKGKTYRAVKKNEEIQLKRISRIKHHIFPDRNLQERSLSAIYFMNKFGIDIWDRLLADLDQNETFANHQLIYL